MVQMALSGQKKWAELQGVNLLGLSTWLPLGSVVAVVAPFSLVPTSLPKEEVVPIKRQNGLIIQY